MSDYKPDKTGTHLMYVLEAQKNSPIDKCLDSFTGKIHSKEECEAIVEALRKLGFRLQVSRVSSTQVIDEEFPGDEDEE